MIKLKIKTKNKKQNKKQKQYCFWSARRPRTQPDPHTLRLTSKKKMRLAIKCKNIGFWLAHVFAQMRNNLILIDARYFPMLRATLYNRSDPHQSDPGVCIHLFVWY